MKKLTYDVHFNDAAASNSKGFSASKQYCKNWIKAAEKTNDSYFADYPGGTVSIVCHQTGETVFEKKIN